jgi:prepilin-type N-terminal cleavage/methylation domain-containing protein
VKRATRRRRSGFSLLELLTAIAIFLIICGVAFGLLTMTMKRYQTDSQVLTSFQEARFGLDQIVRDVNSSGYPPANQFLTLPANKSLYAVGPVAWGTGNGYPATPCVIGACATPGDFDVILESKTDPASPAVQWIRYQLQGTILYRAIVDKPAGGGDPDTATASQFVPYVQNVMNNTPGSLPGGAPVPIFRYICDGPSRPVDCTDFAAGSNNTTKDVRSVSVTLIVMATSADAQTGRPRLVELRGLGRRINPTQ